MDELVGHGVFGVGLGRPRSAQPRQFDVSPSGLRNAPEFEKRIGYVISRSVPAAVRSVIALDDDSLELANRIAESSGLSSKPKVLTRDELRRSIRNEDTHPVVIAAIAVESGRSLLDVSRDLRPAFPSAAQVFIVGFAKTISEEHLRQLRATIIQTAAPQLHEFAVARTMILPRLAARHAWITEQELLQDVLNGMKYPKTKALPRADLLRKRLDVLDRTAEQLVDNLFLSNGDALPLKLQHGFVFWPDGRPDKAHSQADVFLQLRPFSRRCGPTRLSQDRVRCIVVGCSIRFSRRIISDASMTG
jgi:hypothetical protein